MIPYILIFAISFLFMVCSVPVSIHVAYKSKFLDYPCDTLKIHHAPVPLLGGLGIILSIYVNLLVAERLFDISNEALLGLAAALLIVFSVGLYDDYKGLSPGKRLIGQFLAALVVIFVGHITVAFFQPPAFNIVFTIFYLVAAINSINLLDGIDGLATGITLIASVGFLVGFTISENLMGIVLSLGLIGACAGFLIYNFNPAKIFLGDNGSTVLGFLLGILAVIFLSKPNSVNHFMFPILVLIVPIIDSFLTVIRRMKKRMSLFHGDREHFYDYLIRKNFTQRQTTGLMCALGFVGLLAGVCLI